MTKSKPSFAQVTAAVKSIFRKSLTTSSLKKQVASSLKIDENILNEPNYDNLIKIQERLYSKKKSKRKPVVVKAKEDPICSQEIPPSPAIIKQRSILPQRTPVQQMMKENVLKKRKFEDVESDKSRKRMRVEKIKELTPKDMNARVKKMDLPAKSPLAKWALSAANEIFAQASARFDEEIRKRKAAYIAGAGKIASAPKESPIIEANLAKSEQISVIKKPEPAPRIEEQKEDSVLEPPVLLGHKRDTAKTNEHPPALEADASEEERSSESKSDSSEIKISEVESIDLDTDVIMEEADALEVKVAEIIEQPAIVQQKEEEKAEPKPKVMEVKEQSELQKSKEKAEPSQVISEVQSAGLESDVVMEEAQIVEMKVAETMQQQSVPKEETKAKPEPKSKVLHSELQRSAEEDEVLPVVEQILDLQQEEEPDLQQEEAPGILILDDDPTPSMEEDEQEMSEPVANSEETISVIEAKKTDAEDVEVQANAENLSLQKAVSQLRVESNSSSNHPETKLQSTAETTSCGCKIVSTDVQSKFVKKKSKVVVMVFLPHPYIFPSMLILHVKMWLCCMVESHLDLPKKQTPVRSLTHRITDLTKTSPILPVPIKSLLKKTNKKDNAAQTPRRVKFTIPTDAPLGGGKYSRFKKSKRKQPPKPLKDEEVEERIRRGKIQRERKKARGNGFSPRYQSPSSNGKRRPKKNLSPLLSSVPLQRDKIKRLAGKARSNMLQETLKKGNYRKPERPKTERRYGRGKRLVASATKSAKLKKL